MRTFAEYFATLKKGKSKDSFKTGPIRDICFAVLESEKKKKSDHLKALEMSADFCPPVIDNKTANNYLFSKMVAVKIEAKENLLRHFLTIFGYADEDPQVAIPVILKRLALFNDVIDGVDVKSNEWKHLFFPRLDCEKLTPLERRQIRRFILVALKEAATSIIIPHPDNPTCNFEILDFSPLKLKHLPEVLKSFPFFIKRIRELNKINLNFGYLSEKLKNEEDEINRKTKLYHAYMAQTNDPKIFSDPIIFIAKLEYMIGFFKNYFPEYEVLSICLAKLYIESYNHDKILSSNTIKKIAQNVSATPTVDPLLQQHDDEILLVHKKLIPHLKPIFYKDGKRFDDNNIVDIFPFMNNVFSMFRAEVSACNAHRLKHDPPLSKLPILKIPSERKVFVEKVLILRKEVIELVKAEKAAEPLKQTKVENLIITKNIERKINPIGALGKFYEKAQMSKKAKPVQEIGKKINPVGPLGEFYLQAQKARIRKKKKTVQKSAAVITKESQLPSAKP